MGLCTRGSGELVESWGGGGRWEVGGVGGVGGGGWMVVGVGVAVRCGVVALC